MGALPLVQGLLLLLPPPRAARRNQHHASRTPPQTPHRAALVDRRPGGPRTPPHDAGHQRGPRPGGRAPVQRGLQDQRLGLRLHRRADTDQPGPRRHRRLDPDVFLHGRPEADQRLERHLVAVRPERHRAQRVVQRADHRRGRRLHRRSVHVQRQQRRADRLRGQRHLLRRRPPAADHGPDQPGGRRGLLAGRSGSAGGHVGGGRRRHDQQGGVLRRHHPARHRHERALHARGHGLGRGQSFPGGEGLRQHGRLRELHAGRHHRRLGTDRGRLPRSTGRPAGQVGDLRRQALTAADGERDRHDHPGERQHGPHAHRRREPHLHPVELGHRPAGDRLGGRLRQRLGGLRVDGTRPRQGRGHRHAAGGGEGLRRPLPGAVRQDHRSGERLLLPRGHPVPLGRDADRRGTGPRPRDHVRGVQLPAVAPGHVRQGDRRLGEVQQRLGDHGEVHDPHPRRPADQLLVQRLQAGDLRARAGHAERVPGTAGRHRARGRGPDRGRTEVGVRHGRRVRHALAPGRRQHLRLRQLARQVRGGALRHRPVVHQHLPARRAGVGVGDGAAADLRRVQVRREERLPGPVHR